MTQLPTAHRTAQGTILGTVQYMAPEQVEGKEADARSDIWASGACCTRWSRDTTVPGRHARQRHRRDSQGRSPTVSMRQPVAPSALDQLVSVCLAKDPEDRWQSIADVRRQLEWIVKGDAEGVATDVPVDKAWRRRDARRNRRHCRRRRHVARAIGEPAARPTSRAAVVFAIEAPPGLSLAGPAASMSVPQLAVSPDGRHVAFLVANAQGQSSLWLRTLDTQESRPLAGTEGAVDPFWSPDSRSIGFLSQGAVKLTEIAGEGTPRTIGRGPVDTRGGAWSADGTILFYAGAPER